MGISNTVPTDQERALVKGARKSGNSMFARLIKDQHKRMSRMLGYTLFISDPEAWGGFSTVCRARLTVFERAALAVAALRSLPDTYALDTAAAVMGAAGEPLPAFLGGMEDARSWASFATPSELKAYGLACFEAMAPRDKAAFFRQISTVEVTA